MNKLPKPHRNDTCPPKGSVGGRTSNFRIEILQHRSQLESAKAIDWGAHTPTLLVLHFTHLRSLTIQIDLDLLQQSQQATRSYDERPQLRTRPSLRLQVLGLPASKSVTLKPMVEVNIKPTTRPLDIEAKGSLNSNLKQSTRPQAPSHIIFPRPPYSLYNGIKALI